MRSERSWSARSVKTASGGASRRCASQPLPRSSAAGSTDSTWYTSAARSLKMPLSPQYDAIASMRSAMRSKSAPAVSERT